MSTSSPDISDTDVTVVSEIHRRQDLSHLLDPPTQTGLKNTGLTNVTDLHRSKIPPDDPRLKIERQKSRTLRKGPVIAVAACLGGVIVVALAAAMTPSTAPANELKGGGEDTDTTAANDVPLPDMLRDLPAEPTAAPPTSSAQTLPAEPVASAPANGAAQAQSPAAQRAETFRQARYEEFLRARGATLFSPVDEPTVAEALPPRGPAGAGGPAVTKEGATDTPPSQTDPGRQDDPNLQGRKNGFLAKAGVSSSEYLEKGLTVPRSPYELKAGTVIPTVLITGINSDLPGQVVGQVRENVYDTVSGNHLLIPQGSRVIAAYDSMVAWGQERALLCWNRLIRPDGTSITLDCMPGVDLAGYAGVADQVDNHWWRIVSGAVFSSLLAATAQRSQGDVTTFQPSFPQMWASGAAGQINQAGQQVTAKNLQIQPTITVRPGFSVNVLVSKDIILPPYAP